MKYKLKVYSIWEFGMRTDSQGNPHQEDSMYPAFGEQKDSDRTFVLCDGMGGHDAGEVASSTVCETMGEYILNDGHDAEGIFTDADLSGAIAAAYNALDKKDNGSPKKMGTTMTFLKLHQGGATIAHIGDSRVYHIRPGKNGDDTQILYATEDHSLVNELVKVGELTHEEARHSKQKNVITRAMQPMLSPRPNAEVYKTSDIKKGDFFYMCSDGMLELDDMEDGSVLKRVFSDLVESDERRVEILKGATSENSDNHTAFIIHILDVEGEPVPPVIPEAPEKYVEMKGSRTPFSAAPGAGAAKMAAKPKTPPMAEIDDDDEDEDEELLKPRKSNVNKILLWCVILVLIVVICFIGAKFVMSDEQQQQPYDEPMEDVYAPAGSHTGGAQKIAPGSTSQENMLPDTRNQRRNRGQQEGGQIVPKNGPTQPQPQTDNNGGGQATQQHDNEETKKTDAFKGYNKKNGSGAVNSDENTSQSNAVKGANDHIQNRNTSEKVKQTMENIN